MLVIYGESQRSSEHDQLEEGCFHSSVIYTNNACLDFKELGFSQNDLSCG